MIKRVYMVCLGVVMAFMWGVVVVNGAVFQVTTTADSGPGSLRAAITEANINNQDDIIHVPAGVYTLSGSPNEDNNVTGDLDIKTPHKITIVGVGAGTTIIDGNQVDRVLQVHSGVVSISGVTIQNGRGKDGTVEKEYGQSGGGIYNKATLSLQDCVIQNNTGGNGFVGEFHPNWRYCPGGGGAGGGIYNTGSLTLNGCTLSGNLGGMSGGAFDQKLCGQVPTGGDGGGIYNSDGGTLVLEKCTLHHNGSGQGLSWGSDYDACNRGGNGGAICNLGRQTINNCTFSFNFTGVGGLGNPHQGDSGNCGHGGAIYNNGDSVLRSCLIRENFTGTNRGWHEEVLDGRGAGGGIYNENKMTLVDCYITKNYTGPSGGGGGVYNNTHGDLTIQNCTVSGNYTGNGSEYYDHNGGNGGGILNLDMLVLVNSTVSNNKTGKGSEGRSYHDGGNGGNGGGIYNVYNNSVVVLTHCTIAGNATGGGGLGDTAHNYENGQPGNGGGIFCTEGPVKLLNTIVADNVVFGGGRGPDCFGTLDTGGYNLIENISDCHLDGLFEDYITGQDPKLMALANNGGPTPTQALAKGSPAIDAGTRVGYTKDQRGYPRPVDIPELANQGDGSDIGAYEAGLVPVLPPRITLDKTRLVFGCDLLGHHTAAQVVNLTNSGGSTLNWTTTTSADWLLCTPSAGSGAASLAISVAPAEIGPGTYSGTVMIHDPKATNSPQSIAVVLHFYDSSTTVAPIGVVDTPAAYAVVSGSIPVTGWAVDAIGIQSIKLYRSPGNGEGQSLIYIGDGIRVEGARPDVAALYPDYPESSKAGWGYMLLTPFLPEGGNGTFLLHAIATDIEGNQFTLGKTYIVCDNAHAVKPFGAIDTPAQGGTASGSQYINFGWALTPLPNTIPFDGSTITVWVDGNSLGHPVYNQAREDIIVLFPGYNNTHGAVGYYYLNTRPYPNGLHTIAWSVEDDAGNMEGIGSRYFTIQNVTTPDYGAQTSEPTATLPQNMEFWHEPNDSDGAVQVKIGYNQKIRAKTIYPNQKGQIEIYIQALERLEIHFFDSLDSGAVTLASPPIGSSLDRERGIFYWQLGLGFLGEFRLLFTVTSPAGERRVKEIRVFVGPHLYENGGKIQGK